MTRRQPAVPHIAWLSLAMDVMTWLPRMAFLADVSSCAAPHEEEFIPDNVDLLTEYHGFTHGTLVCELIAVSLY
jgi:hypothetical protein